MLLVHGLPGDPEGLRHLRPVPAGPEGTLDLGVLEPVGEAAQRDDRRQPIGGLGGGVKVCLGHGATVVDKWRAVNRGCSGARFGVRDDLGLCVRICCRNLSRVAPKSGDALLSSCMMGGGAHTAEYASPIGSDERAGAIISLALTRRVGRWWRVGSRTKQYRLLH